MNDPHTLSTSNRMFLTLVVIGAVALAACAPGASLGESKQTAGDVTVQAMTTALATREATRPAETYTPLPSETSVGRTHEATETPYPGLTGTAVAGQDVEISGAIELIDGNSLMIGGRKVVINIRTEAKFDLAIGLVVTVHGTVQADGSILAREIKN